MLYGIDVSSNNRNYESIDTRGLSFCVVKVSEGATYKNELRHAQASWARGRGLIVGAYHWTHPTSDVTAQANNFAEACHAVEPWSFWALDNEDTTPASDETWGHTVAAMLAKCKATLGAGRGLDYNNQYFHTSALVPLAQANNWWLPNYGPNDGNVHALPTSATGVVIHQYASRDHFGHSLDHSVVLDEARFHAICGGVGVRVPPPITPTTHPTVRMGDHSFAVKQAQVGMDVGCGQHLTADGVFGPATLAAVEAVQRFFGLTADGIVGPRTWAAIDFAYFTHGGR